MGDPELHSDEKILLTSNDVFVKSIPFEAILTSKRIILVDRKKNLIPPKDILHATIRDVEPAENAIRDQIITLSLITSTGDTRQLVLTFSRTAGGGRKRERDEWVRMLRELTSSSIQKAIRKVIPSFDQEPKKMTREPVSPKIEIAGRPAVKKEIEGPHPIKKIVETGNIPPKPVETSSLPFGSFCSRCGNRVPPESTFCNRCGSKISAPGQEAAAEPMAPQAPIEQPLPVVSVLPPVVERKERPIEKEIQSIEPLIEGSVPRTIEAPAIPSIKTAEPPAAESPLARAAQSIIDAAKSPVPVESGATPSSPVVPPSEILPGRAHPPARPRQIVTLAVILVVVIALAGGAFLYWKYLGGGGTDQGSGGVLTTAVTPTPAPTPVPTSLPTTRPVVTTIQPTPTPVLIPPEGVWVRVIYSGSFKGTLGTAADQRPVTDTGDRFYAVSTAEGIVQAAIQKVDGSGQELVVEVYKTGALVKRGTTIVPKGIVEIQVDLKPPKTTTLPPPRPTTPAGNITTAVTTGPVPAPTIPP